MPVTLQPASLKYKDDNGDYQTITCIEGLGNSDIKTILISVFTQLVQLIPSLAFATNTQNATATINALNTALGILNGYSVTSTLTHCSLSNSAISVDANSDYISTVNIDTNCIIQTISITMGGTDITSSVWNSSNNTITINGVTGNIAISITARSTIISSISATFNTNGALIREGDTLDSLKQYLTVNVLYNDNVELPVSNYTLSGSLALAANTYDKSTCTITVTYSGETTTFNVNVYNALTVDKVTLPTGYTQLVMIQGQTVDNTRPYISSGIDTTTIAYAKYGVQIPEGINNGENWHVLSSQYIWYPYFRQGNSGARNFQVKYSTSGSSGIGLEATWDSNTNYAIEGISPLKINGVTQESISKGSQEDTSTLYIFARHGGTSCTGNLRLYYLKLYNSQNELIYNFIPCKNSSNVTGLYDTINDTFRSTSNTVNFLAGAVVV